MRLRKRGCVYFFHWMEFTELTFRWFFLFGFAGPGALNKDPIFWIDGARPVNTCILLYFPGNVPPCTWTAAWCNHPQKYICKYKKWVKFSEISFFKLKIRERVWQTHFWQEWIHWISNEKFLLVLWTWVLLILDDFCCHVICSPWASTGNPNWRVRMNTDKLLVLTITFQLLLIMQTFTFLQYKLP
jgi:hypothetical protein